MSFLNRIFSNTDTRFAATLGKPAEKERTFVVLRLPAKLDATSRAGNEALAPESVLRSRCTVILDCSECQYIDSYGIGLLVEQRNNARAKGASVVLAAPTDRVRKVLRVTQIDTLIPVYDSIDDAIAHARGERAHSTPETATAV